MKRKIHALIIDPQNDFCDLPTEYLTHDPALVKQGIAQSGVAGKPGDWDIGLVGPALAVPGAHMDMVRSAEAMMKGSRGLSDITVTLDSHHHLGIERPTFWMQGDGTEVSPFTEITEASVRAGLYIPRNPTALPRVLSYLNTLEAAGRYKLMVWTVHCEIGTWGHGVHADIRKAYNAWEAREFGIVNMVTKGSNPWTEHYSALMAEVPDPTDASTQLNRALIDDVASADLTFAWGEAGSHCFKATMEHLVDNFGSASLAKLAIVTDCISAVSGFEKQYADFLVDMKARGLQLVTAADMTAELVANSRK